MKVECPRCHTHVEKPLHGDPVCPTCGFGAPEGTAPAAGAPPAPGMSTPPAAGAMPGATWEHTGAPTSAPKQGLAITSLVLGILGCCVPYIGFLLAIGAIVTGAIGLTKVKAQPQEYGGRGMALAGLILGIVGVVLGIIFLLLMFVYAGFLYDAFNCEENPDSDFCQGLDEGNQAQFQPAPAAPMTALLAPIVARRPWHAG